MVKMIAALTAWIAFLPAILLADETVTPGQFISNKTLVSFWSSACAPCAKQLPLLVDLAQNNPEIHVALISLKAEGDEALPQALPGNMRVYEVENAGMSLHNFSATAKMLPFSAFLRENGSVCDSHAGIQSMSTLEAWVKQC